MDCQALRLVVFDRLGSGRLNLLLLNGDTRMSETRHGVRSLDEAVVGTWQRILGLTDGGVDGDNW